MNRCRPWPGLAAADLFAQTAEGSAGFCHIDGWGLALPALFSTPSAADDLLAALPYVREAAFFVLLIVAAFTDTAYSKVYNWLTLPAIGLGLALHGVGGGLVGGFSLADSLLGFAVGGAVFVIFFALGWVGPGDVKLMAAIGALRGQVFVIYAIFLSACVGAVMALGWFIWQGRFWEGLKGSLLLIVSPKRFRQRHPGPKTTIPYGLAISVGGMWAWFLWLDRAA